MKSILFFGIQPQKIIVLQDVIRSMAGEWQEFLPIDSTEALEWINRTYIDVAVVDILLPDHSAIEFLSQIQKIHPNIVRIAITDHRSVIEQLRTASLAQQFLGKSFDRESLKAAIRRALMLHELLQNNMLQKMVSQVQNLPSLPNLYLQITDELNSPNPSADRVGQLISMDLSMSAKVLQIVNSVHFGLSYPVASPAQATNLLGLETIRDIVLSIKVFSSFDQLKIRQLGLTRLWHHSVTVGALSRLVARNISGDKKSVNYAFTTGLLHDIGKLILAENLPMKYQSAMGMAIQQKVCLHDAEEAVFGASHAQVGAYLLWLWNLPEEVVTATAYHHTPMLSPVQAPGPLTSVHLANTFAHEFNLSPEKWAPSPVSQEYVEKLNLANSVDQIRKTCEETNRAD